MRDQRLLHGGIGSPGAVGRSGHGDEVHVVDRAQRVERGDEVAGRERRQVLGRAVRPALIGVSPAPVRGMRVGDVFGGGGSTSVATSSPPGSPLTIVDEIARMRGIHRQPVVA